MSRRAISAIYEVIVDGAGWPEPRSDQPLRDMFWGDLHGQLDDPFGHRWNISQHLRDVPHDVVVAAAQAFAEISGLWVTKPLINRKLPVPTNPSSDRDEQLHRPPELLRVEAATR